VEHGRPIYEHVLAHLPEQGPGLAAGGDTLPDEPEPAGPVRWMPGALDGVATHHLSGRVTDRQVVEEVGTAVRAALRRRGSERAYRRMYAALRRHHALPVVRPLLERLAAAGVPAGRLRDLGVRLATTSAHREPVKYGIALVGAAGWPQDRDLLRVLGRHEEFTLFAAAALRAGGAGDEEVWRLARQVGGWGRIHLVERLRHTADPRIRDWILREGFRNAVMDEYLAHVAATTGGLVQALERPRPDDGLLVAACDIVVALLAGGPAEDVDDYAEGARAVRLLVDHLLERADRLEHFLAAHAVGRFLAEETPAWAAREQRGWTPRLRADLAADCAEVVARPLWAPLAEAGLAADDPAVFHRADQVAQALGLDRFPAHWRRLLRLRSAATDADWHAVLDAATDDTLPRVLDLAERSLPLARIASGPADHPGLGPEYRAHQVLDVVLRELGRLPGRGWPLVAAGLRSPLTRNRTMAVEVLRAWGPRAWPDGARAALCRAHGEEPRADVRNRISALLRVPAGHPGSG
jgi:hypothetical protein